MNTQHIKKYTTQNAQAVCLGMVENLGGSVILPAKLFAQAKTLGGSKIY